MERRGIGKWVNGVPHYRRQFTNASNKYCMPTRNHGNCKAHKLLLTSREINSNHTLLQHCIILSLIVSYRFSTLKSSTTTNLWRSNHAFISTVGTDTMVLHDDVIKWKHFPHYRDWPFLWVIHRRPVNSPHTKASDAELWCFLWSASE